MLHSDRLDIVAASLFKWDSEQKTWLCWSQILYRSWHLHYLDNCREKIWTKLCCMRAHVTLWVGRMLCYRVHLKLTSAIDKMLLKLLNFDALLGVFLTGCQMWDIGSLHSFQIWSLNVQMPRSEQARFGLSCQKTQPQYRLQQGAPFSPTTRSNLGNLTLSAETI